jgi:cysteine-rich repeat protein
MSSTLDGPITISQCINPGDCECTCGNGVLDMSEDCDDGNGMSGDGCSSTCLVEETVGLIGMPVGGGSVDITISGIVIPVPTTAGTIHDLIVAIANRINIDTALRDLGITAFSDGDALVTSGTIDLIDITDPGVMVPEPGSLLLQTGALCSLLVLARRRRGRSS